MDSGTLIADRYRLDRVIASGGMGSVWRAEDERLDRPVAVKVLHAGLDGAQRPRERFEREAKTLASLKGPGCVEVYDFGEERDGDRTVPYLVMELVEGVSLAELLNREERLDPARTMRIVADTAEALAAAHRRGIVHRDVKPGNILVDAEDRVKVVDFGISLFAHRSRLTPSDTVLGTAPYVSPEQLRDKNVTGASDLYSLGAVAFECLTGAPPFDAADPAAVIHGHLYSEPPALPADVPADVAGVVEKSLRKTPAERWESGEILAAACRAATTGAHPIGEGVAAQTLQDVPATGSSVGAGPAGTAPWAEAAGTSAGERTPATSGASTPEPVPARSPGSPVVGPSGAASTDPAEPSVDPAASPAGPPVTPSSGPLRPPAAPPGTPPAGPLRAPAEPPRKRRRLAVAGIAVALVLTAVAVVAWGPWGGESPGASGRGEATVSAAAGAESSGEPSPSPSTAATTEPTGEATPTGDAATSEEAGGEGGDTTDESTGGEETTVEDDGGDDLPKEGPVPDVLGLTTFSARDMLDAEGFPNAVAAVGYYAYTPEPQHCEVMAQSPSAGETADYDAQITVYYHERTAEGTTCEW